MTNKEKIAIFSSLFRGRVGAYPADGRKTVKHILDFRDEKVEFLERQFKKRNRFYKKL